MTTTLRIPATYDHAYPFQEGFPAPEAAERAHEDADLERAVLAYRFWYPTVSVEGVFAGNREIGIEDGRTIGYGSTGPRQVGFTLNSDTPYAVAALDLSGRAMVVELPPGPYFGLVNDHHQRWLMDLGLPGPDRGRGGKHVILPPGFTGQPPPEHQARRSATNLVLLTMRVLPVDRDTQQALEALHHVKVYPLDEPGAQLPFIDTTEREMDSTCLRWESNLDFWRILHGILDAEPVIEEFRPMYGLLTALGIGRGQLFHPDARTTDILERATRIGRDQMLVAAFAGTDPRRQAWPDRRWEWVNLVHDNADFETPAGLDLEARDRWFIQAIAASPALFRRQAGSGSLTWLGVRDRRGAYLDGGTDYTLTIPQPVPADLFWSITLYDADTRSQVQTDQDKGALRSNVELPDGGREPIVLRFGPTQPPAGAATGWIKTAPGRGWFAYIRLYGPSQPALDGTWKPGDFELA